MRTTMRTAATHLGMVLALTVGLAACGSDGDDQAGTETDAQGGSDDERVAALEDELAAMRDELGASGDSDGPGDTQTDDRDADDSDSDDADGDGGEESARQVDERVYEVDETLESDDGRQVVTVQRVIVADYHVEVELTAENSDPEETFPLINDLYTQHANSRRPSLFDQQDRRFEYQHAAGMDIGDDIQLEPGQRLEAVVMFGGAVAPDAEVLTFQMLDGEWEWQVALGGNG